MSNSSIQISHSDFMYWNIFSDIEQLRECEELFEYPPRLQIIFQHINTSKSLSGSLVISKRNNKNSESVIGQYAVIKEVIGIDKYIHGSYLRMAIYGGVVTIVV